MTRLGDLPTARIELNPGAPFPPFPIWLSVPSEWSILDTNPGTWHRGADELIDTTFQGSRLPAKERREVFGVVESLVADCQEAGAALSLLTLGRKQDGELASFGIHLAFAGDQQPASIGRVRDMLPRAGTSTEINTGVGPAIEHRDRMTMVVPGTATIKAMSSIQVFVPFPETNWTLIMATASAFPELTDALDSLMRTMAASVRLSPEVVEQGDEPVGPDPEPTPTALVPIKPPNAPGIERGFGTLVPRRLDPDPFEHPDAGAPEGGSSAADGQVGAADDDGPGDAADGEPGGRP